MVLKGIFEGYGDPLFVVTDAVVRRKVYPLVKPLLPAHKLLVLPAGEGAKVLDEVARIWTWLGAQGADRQAVLVALGGGAVSDVAGFAAATYLRGIRWVAMPTTLLAMCDAAYGGKTGINLGGAKNQVGAFWAPEAVVSEPRWLETLPYGELLSGWAEVLKHALLQGPEAWARIRTMECDDAAGWPYAIALSQEVKQRIVAEDPREQGLRRALNLGHTLGHALEGFFLHAGTPILHGQAVALGMLGEAWVAHRQGACGAELLAEIEEAVLCQYPLLPYEKADIAALVRLLAKDKKRLGTQLRYVALHQPGRYDIDATLTPAEARQAFAYLM